LSWISVWPHPYSFLTKILYTLSPVHATYLSYQLMIVSVESYLYNCIYFCYIEVPREHILLSKIMIFWDVTRCSYESHALLQ
jgi:hypothetical protein